MNSSNYADKSNSHALLAQQQITIEGISLIIPETVWPPYQTARIIAGELMPEYQDEIDGGTVIDVATGSGLIALVAGRMGAKKVIASDLNPRAITATRKNWERNDLPKDVLTAVLSNAFENFPSEVQGRVDLIISNPPVQPRLETSDEVKKRHSSYDWNEASKGGRAVLDAILMDGIRFLRQGGMILTSTSTRHGWNKTQSILDSLVRGGRVATWREVYRKRFRLADFYRKYFSFWLEMEEKDGDRRIWSDGSDWFHDFIVIEVVKS